MQPIFRAGSSSGVMSEVALQRNNTATHTFSFSFSHNGRINGTDNTRDNGYGFSGTIANQSAAVDTTRMETSAGALSDSADLLVLSQMRVHSSGQLYEMETTTKTIFENENGNGLDKTEQKRNTEHLDTTAEAPRRSDELCGTNIGSAITSDQKYEMETTKQTNGTRTYAQILETDTEKDKKPQVSVAPRKMTRFLDTTTWSENMDRRERFKTLYAKRAHCYGDGLQAIYTPHFKLDEYQNYPVRELTTTEKQWTTYRHKPAHAVKQLDTYVASVREQRRKANDQISKEIAEGKVQQGPMFVESMTRVKTEAKEAQKRRAKEHYRRKLAEEVFERSAANTKNVMDRNTRTLLYAKYHKCPDCKNKFHVIDMRTDLAVFRCTCSTSNRDGTRCMRCSRCGIEAEMQRMSHVCGCESYICPQCRIHNYVYTLPHSTFDEESRTYKQLPNTCVQHYDAHVPNYFSMEHYVNVLWYTYDDNIGGGIIVKRDFSHHVSDLTSQFIRYVPAESRRSFFFSLKTGRKFTYAELFSNKGKNLYTSEPGDEHDLKETQAIWPLHLDNEMEEAMEQKFRTSTFDPEEFPSMNTLSEPENLIVPPATSDCEVKIIRATPESGKEDGTEVRIIRAIKQGGMMSALSKPVDTVVKQYLDIVNYIKARVRDVEKLVDSSSKVVAFLHDLLRLLQFFVDALTNRPVRALEIIYHLLNGVREESMVSFTFLAMELGSLFTDIVKDKKDHEVEKKYIFRRFLDHCITTNTTVTVEVWLDNYVDAKGHYLTYNEKEILMKEAMKAKDDLEARLAAITIVTPPRNSSDSQTIETFSFDAPYDFKVFYWAHLSASHLPKYQLNHFLASTFLSVRGFKDFDAWYEGNSDMFIIAGAPYKVKHFKKEFLAFVHSEFLRWTNGTPTPFTDPFFWSHLQKFPELFLGTYKFVPSVPQSLDWGEVFSPLFSAMGFVGDSVTLMSSMAKAILPTLVLIKTTCDLPAAVQRLMTTFDKWWHSKLTTNEWIASELEKSQSVVRLMATAAIAYEYEINAMKYWTPIKRDGMTTSDLRALYYQLKPQASNAALKAGHLDNTFLTFMTKLDTIMAQPPIGNQRQEPFSIIVYGQPGVGKSTGWMPIAATILGFEGPTAENEIMRTTHTYNPASEYHTGMVGKRIVLFDDFGQNLESGEVTDFLALKGGAAFPINSANIVGKEIKGCYASPELLVACTNFDAQFLAQRLGSPDALDRRYDLEITVLERMKDHESKVFKITRCPAYVQLQGQVLNIKQLRAVGKALAIILTEKRQQHKDRVKSLLELPLEECDLDFLKNLPPPSEMMNPAPEKPTTTVKSRHYEEIGDAEALLAAFSRDMPEWGKKSLRGLAPKKPERTARQEAGEEDTSEETKELKKNPLADRFMSYLTRNTIEIYEDIHKYLTELPKTWKAKTWSLLKTIFMKTIEWGTVIMAAYYLLSKTQPKTSSESGEFNGKKVKPKIYTMAKKQAAPNAILEKLKRNMAKLRRPDGQVLLATFVRGTYALTAKHFFLTENESYIPEGTEITVRFGSNGVQEFTTKFSKDNLIELEGNVDILTKTEADYALTKDAVIYCFPRELCTPRKDVVKHFWNGDFNPHRRPVVRLDLQGFSGSVPEFSYDNGEVTHVVTLINHAEIDDSIYHAGAEASYVSRQGSCGSPVLLGDSQSQPILGIHIATGADMWKSSSIFHYVSAPQLERAIQKHMRDNPVCKAWEESYKPIGPDYYVAELGDKSQLEFLGFPYYTSFQPVKTDLRPSLLYEAAGPHRTEPSILSKLDKRMFEKPTSMAHTTPFEVQLFKTFERSEGQFSPEELEIPKTRLKEWIVGVANNSMAPPQLLDFDEAINGLPHIPGNTAMDMDSSTGYPYINQGITKVKLFERVVDDDSVHSRIVARDPCVKNKFETNIKSLKSGTVPFIPFIMTLKDEKLKLKKIYDAQKTRIFACGSVDHFLLCRRYFYTTMLALYHLPISQTFMPIGMDRLSGDWEHLCKRMLEVGDQGFDADFTNFDRTLQLSLVRAAVEILLAPVEHMLTALERETLITLIANPSFIWKTFVFRTSGGNASGCLLTMVINCIVNELLHRAAWVHIMSENRPDMATMKNYERHTRHVRGGDDTMTTVSLAVRDLYNGITVSDYLRSRGMKVTSVDKTDNMVAYKPFRDLVFLKNQTTVGPVSNFDPLPDWDSIVEISYWVRINKNNPDILQATEDNANVTLRSAFFWGREKFNDLRQKFILKEPRLELLQFNELLSIYSKFRFFVGSHPDHPTAIDQGVSRIPVLRKRRAEPNTALEQVDDMTIRKIKAIKQSKPGLDAEKRMPDAEKATAPVHDNISTPGHLSDVLADTDTQQKATTSAHGTSIQDTEQMATSNFEVGNIPITPKNDRSVAHMNDIAWDLTKIEEKFTLIGTATWNTSDTVGTSIFTKVLPKDILVTPAQKIPFDVMTYWKCSKIRFYVLVKASPFYQGALLCGYSPLFRTPVSARKLINIGGTVLNAARDESALVEIPFRYPVGMIESDKDVLGTFSVEVLSVLKTGATNIQNVEVVLYADIVDNHFKVPEVIPSTSYVSHKQARIIKAIPESGTEVKQGQAHSINDPLKEEDLTKMCAGSGYVDRLPVGHFQDQDQDLVQIFKRYRRLGVFYVPMKAQAGHLVSFTVDALHTYAQDLLGPMFRAYRGSLLFKVRLMGTTWAYGPETMSGSQSDFRPLAYVKFYASQPTADTFPSFKVPETVGRTIFTKDDPAEFMIPYCAPTFVAMLQQENYEKFRHPGRMDICFENFSTAEGEVVFEVSMALADDYHVGFFVGYESNKPAALPPAFTHKWELEQYPFQPVKIIRAHKESGVLEFIDRALETTIPIVEKASVLGSMLDAHPVTYPPTPMRVKDTGTENSTDIVQYVDRLLTTNHNGMNLPDVGAFGVKDSETNIQNLFTKTKSWVDTFNWKSSDAVGTILKQYTAGPGLNGMYNSESLHDQLPLLWNYWTGSTIYQLEIMASGMHRGQLLCVYHIVNSDGAQKGPTLADATQTYFTTIDLAQTKGTVSIMLPYLSPYPYQALGHSRKNDPEPKTVGTLYIYVQNTLRATDGVANNIDIQVFKRFGHDFQVRVFGNSADQNRYPATRVDLSKTWEELEAPSIPMGESLDEEAFERMLALSRSKKARKSGH